jgi:hypothetical protein
MSIKSFSSVVSSSVSEYPEKLKRVFENCENPSQIVDQSMKVSIFKH